MPLGTGLRAPVEARGREAHTQAAVEMAHSAEDARVQEAGEAHRTTVVRAEAARALRVHAGELAEVALEDPPPLREGLGLRQRTGCGA